MAWRKSSHSYSTGNCAEVAAWRKSTFSLGNGECPEVATLPLVAVRDTKQDGTGPVLTFSADSWGTFTSRVKASLSRKHGNGPATPDRECGAVACPGQGADQVFGGAAGLAAADALRSGLGMWGAR